MLLDTLGACLLGSMLAIKGVIQAGEGTISTDRIFNAASFKK